MRRTGMCVLLAGLLVASSGGPAAAQESPAAKSARKRLKQKITIELKETGTKAFLDEIKREMDQPVSFKIDNASGVSNNSKMTLTAKDQPVEKVLNDLADKYDFGWFVVSNPKDRYDGWVVIRRSKEKERGYEAGKGPKGATKDARLQLPGEPNRTAAFAPLPDRRFVRVGVSGSVSRFRVNGLVR